MMIKRRILDTIRQDQYSILRNSSKTKFISSISNSLTGRAPYVDILGKKNDRAIICNIRISSHKLAIETGRYRGIASSHRLCLACTQNLIENELHFLLQCPAYTTQRNTFYNKISKEIPHFKNFNDNCKLSLMLNNNNMSILKYTVQFISDSFMHRNSLI